MVVLTISPCATARRTKLLETRLERRGQLDDGKLEQRQQVLELRTAWAAVWAVWICRVSRVSRIS
jgi:hypothetical protein